MNKETKILIGLIILMILLGVGDWFYISETQKQSASIYEEDGLQYISKTEGRSFYVYSHGEWDKKFLKGVNLGAAKPGCYPGELAITKEEYLRWFGYISDMNADVIRVYTTMKPDFYDALYEFNEQSKKPLYLMQGVWINEGDIAELNDAFADNGRILNDFIQDSTDLVDIIHGNATLPEQAGFASGVYQSDVSPYVVGWILGIEWDPNFVEGTNSSNPDKLEYAGNFLYTAGASPFEAFLCEAGDKVLDYEASKYHMTRALSFTNWLTTDMLTHPNEPYETEDMAEVNTENILAKERCKAGLFASYHVYPYYPEFMNYQKDYVSFKDEEGAVNTYQAYLRDLYQAHTKPVLVAEFGVPASRGMAHESKYSGYNQGKHDETEQGKIDVSLLNDIYDEGYCGALVFSWQDEWFKRTWNTMDFDLSEQRPYWSNPQTNEQEFGLMAFDPGEAESTCYVDGDGSEWENDQPVSSDENVSLSVKFDEKYVYFMAKLKKFDFNKDSLFIPIDTIHGQGNSIDKSRNLEFERGADFLIQIKGENDSKILVDAYYDSFYYLYGEQLNMIETNAKYEQKDSGIFNPMYHCLSREIYLPEDKKTIPFSKYETGSLQFGNGNPEEDGYDSMTDFAYLDGCLEVRIPWQMLNVMDPSTKAIMGDLYANQAIEPQISEKIYLGAAVLKEGSVISKEINMSSVAWSGWKMPTYHERLKPSYYILKEAFKTLP